MTIRIIIIDDQAQVREAIIRVFNPVKTAEDMMAQLMGGAAEDDVPAFAITEASSGEEGVKILRDAQNTNVSFDLAIVDMRMPDGMNGVETIRKIREFDKKMPVVVYSGWVDFTMAELMQVNGDAPFEVVPKPHARELLDTVHQMVENPLGNL